MPDARPTLALHASITLDGRLADPSIELHAGGSVEVVDARRAGALLAANAVREIYLTVRPRIDGRQNSPTLSGLPTPEFFPRSLTCRLVRMETRDGECFLHYRVVDRNRTRRARL